MRRQEYGYLPGSTTLFATRIDEQVYYYHCDHLGTPRRLTNAFGEVVWAADYDAFGQARVARGLIHNPLRFAGQYHDQETGWHYNRFRYYSPHQGRYLSQDPLGFLAGANFYAYVDNNPIGASDPLGLWWKTALSIVAGVAAGVAVGAAVLALAPAAVPLAIILGGTAAGAVSFGLNEGLNQEEFCLSCILKEARRGALLASSALYPSWFFHLRQVALRRMLLLVASAVVLAILPIS